MRQLENRKPNLTPREAFPGNNMIIDPVDMVVGSFGILGNSHLESQIDSGAQLGSHQDVLAGLMIQVDYMLNPANIVTDPVGYTGAVSFNSGNIHECRTAAFCNGIVNDSHNVLIHHANHPNLGVATNNVTQMLQAMHALQDGANLSPSQLKNEVHGVLQSHRN